MTEALPMAEAARQVHRTLVDAGYEAYFAGGCVRDLVLDRVPHDYDVASAARPEQVMALFPRTVAVGAAFGVVIVLHGGHEIEVATFRADGVYLDGRRPSSVSYSSAEEDVARRDFTINGLLYDPSAEQVIDHVGGQRDLRDGRIRCIGAPRARFGEDKLRMLRAVRFAVRFDFVIEPGTREAIVEMAPGIHVVSHERIRDELLKMLGGPTPHRALRLLDELGLLSEVLPEVAALKGVAQPPEFHPEGDVLEHTALLLSHLEPPAGLPSWELEALWLGALLHDVGKPGTQTETDRIRFNGHESEGARLAEEIARRLRLSSHHVQRVRELVADHMRFLDVERMKRAKLLRLLRKPHIESLLALHRADRLAGTGDLRAHDFCRAEIQTLEPEQLRPPRLLDGHALRDLGVVPGPRMGALLRAVEDAQLGGEISNREQAEALVRALLEEEGAPS